MSLNTIQRALRTSSRGQTLRLAAVSAHRRASSSSSSSSSSSTSKPSYVTWSTSSQLLDNWSKNETLSQWIFDRIRLMSPARVHLCDGSDQENEMLLTQMVHSGTIIPVNKDIRPNSYVARSPLSDVARVEERTFICTENEEDAGFTNNWKEPEATQQQMTELFTDCMRGRTMYVVPFSMGPIGSEFSRIGVQITDSPYAVVSMRIMTRMGKEALDALGADGDFVPCVHSLGQPLTRGSADVPWPCDKDNKWIVHFPEQGRIWSYGSGYGGNALLGKKCLALRIASFMAREEGWLAEHMLIVGITNPEGDKKYVCGAFPSACGKTNLAMMNPNLPGWKVECVGDDIAWMRVKEGDGRLWAINPEAGFFGVAPGTSYKSNPNAMNMLKQNVIFTNVAIKPDGDVWWEDMTDEKPEQALSWLRTEWYPDQNTDAAHPNARFTVPASQCGVMDPNWESPEGVPVSAIVFGARRSSTMPLVYQARSWEHGVFMGATMNSETTAAAAGKRGVLRPDPFAMKPFCGYNMGDYFNHWLSFSERTDESQLPKIFHVNWFRKNSAGKFMWPGFGDNIRVIKWIFQRCDEDSVESDIATDSPIGFLPTEGSLDLSDLDVPAETMKSLFKVDPVEWKNEIARNQQFFDKFGDRLPARIQAQLDQLKTRIAQAEAAKPKQ